MTINEYDIIALTEETLATDAETSQTILLHQGQVGTILTNLDNEAFLVDFADSEGHTYAMETVPLQKIMRLLHEPVVAAA